MDLEVRKLGLKLTDACNPLAHTYTPLGAKCHRIRGGEGDARFLCPAVIASPGIGPFLWGRGFLVQLCRVHFNQRDYLLPPRKEIPRAYPVPPHLKG